MAAEQGKGTPAGKVPALNIERVYSTTIPADELARALADHFRAQEFEAQVKDLTLPIEFSLENMNYFIDWTKSSPFEVIRGEGECAV